MLHSGIDEAILRSRHSIIDKFLLSTLAFGVIGASVTIWRDITSGFFAANSVMNSLLVALLGAAWIYRAKLAYSVKGGVMFFVFLSMAVKQLYLFGPVSAGVLFYCFCCLVLMLSMSVRNALITAVALSMMLPIVGYLHFSGIAPIAENYKFLNSITGWFTAYTVFLLTAVIIIVGIGQVRQELNNNFVLLRNSVVDLHKANEQLTSEIQLKNSYADSLEITSKKFQSLFEGSRDGVLLLDSNARIIEANQAVADATGYSLEELRKINVFDLLEERYRAESLKRFEKNIRGDLQAELVETSIISKEGKRVYVEINSNVILADDEVMVLSTVRDVSFRKQMENEKFNAALEAEERERERFSKDLHDDLGPVFSTLNLYLQTLSNKETDDSKRTMLNNLSGIVDSAVKQVREISHNLSPHLLRKVGLFEAVRTHLRRYTEQAVLQGEFIFNGDENGRLPGNIEIAVYRIFLELMNNTVKHSEATKVRVEVEQRPNELIFNYVDNGKGFNPNNRSQSGGIGLLNIESRINALRGKVQFRYENNEMVVAIKIPI